jgi:hypothetical protein
MTREENGKLSANRTTIEGTSWCREVAEEGTDI